MGVSKHRKGERRRRIACKDERGVRIIATSRAVEIRREIREGVVSFPSFSGFSVLRRVTMSELRERCRLLAI